MANVKHLLTEGIGLSPGGIEYFVTQGYAVGDPPSESTTDARSTRLITRSLRYGLLRRHRLKRGLNTI